MNWNSYLFIQENLFENVIWKMVAILSRPQCVEWAELGESQAYKRENSPDLSSKMNIVLR